MCKMTAMKQAVQTETFEQVLFDYVDMCYSVALTMTRNPQDARELTRYVMTRAWRRRDSADARTGIKMKLLTAIRERYLQYYRHAPFKPGSKAARAERNKHVLSEMPN